ncbi:hypothetical protein O0L34_g10690 [Tuta absoluta]|nr:hypothetical protein O0L34_g10690 [Tuta absoluta]
MSKSYASNNILLTMGGDFNYQDALIWFDNLDKLITTRANTFLKLFVMQNVYCPKVSDFLAIVGNMTKAYNSNNILVTMGDDFNYQDATVWFDNLDKLIVYTNMKAGKEGLKVHLFYSTPQCYLKAVKDSNPTLPTKQDDFFPYASEPKNYWTGYYTSRPTTKYFERETNRYLQMAKQMQVLADLEKHNMFVLNELKAAVGIMQHHDAITGTEQQHVAHDYERILNDAIEDALIIPRQAFNKYMQGDATKQPIFTYERCRLNESSCDVSEKSEQFVVTVYNHLAWERNEPVRVPVLDGNYEVYAPNGDKIKSQLVDIPEAVIKIPTRFSEATHEIVFIAYLKPLSYKSYYIRKIKAEDFWKENDAQPLEEKIRVGEESGDKRVGDGIVYETDMALDDLKQVELLVKEAESLSQAANEQMMSDDPLVVTRYPDDLLIENEHLKIRVNPLQRAVVTLKSSANDDEVALKNVQFGFYPTTDSGAYIFRPNNSTPEDIHGDYTQVHLQNTARAVRCYPTTDSGAYIFRPPRRLHTGTLTEYYTARAVRCYPTTDSGAYIFRHPRRLHTGTLTEYYTARAVRCYPTTDSGAYIFRHPRRLHTGTLTEYYTARAVRCYPTTDRERTYSDIHGDYTQVHLHNTIRHVQFVATPPPTRERTYSDIHGDYTQVHLQNTIRHVQFVATPPPTRERTYSDIHGDYTQVHLQNTIRHVQFVATPPPTRERTYSDIHGDYTQVHLQNTIWHVQFVTTPPRTRERTYSDIHGDYTQVHLQNTIRHVQFVATPPPTGNVHIQTSTEITHRYTYIILYGTCSSLLPHHRLGSVHIQTSTEITHRYTYRILYGTCSSLLPHHALGSVHIQTSTEITHR